MRIPHWLPVFGFCLRLQFAIVLIAMAQTIAFGQGSNEFQPRMFQTRRLLEALDYLGAPIAAADSRALHSAMQSDDTIHTVSVVERILDGYCLFHVQINPESRVKVEQGTARPALWQTGWRTFLIKVVNQAGITAPLAVASDQAKQVYGVTGDGFNGLPLGPPQKISLQDVSDRWLEINLYTRPPMKQQLSGTGTEYFIVQLYSRDTGKRAARFNFSAGQSTEDLGFRNAVDITFECKVSTPLTFHILDENGKPATASFLIRDNQGHVYPSQAKRLAPDFFFQQQVYRVDGEQMPLPAGEYMMEYGRGPEYLSQSRKITVVAGQPQTLIFQLERWIDPSKLGWYSGDHHIHAAGCSHYETPTEGVDPADMMRHILGEGVNVASVLTWGPGYYHQKQFFEGKDNKLSTSQNLMRYDLEISGFPSSHSGHVVLLRLKDQYYPGTSVLEDWPTWTLPVLKWAKAQGSVTGYAHSGLGLAVNTNLLPNYEMPKFDGIGANEYIVTVTQDAVDFISTMDTPPNWELNIWYHTLNCGYRTRISGETDFPCMSDDKVAHGRSYVKLDGKLNFNDWAEGIKNGRTYVSDGKSHLFNFSANGVEVGTKGSEIRLAKGEVVHVTAKVAGLLSEKTDTAVHPLRYDQDVWNQRPFWSLKKARIGNGREVPVQLVVNGEVVSTQTMMADGLIRDIKFDAKIDRSSWIAIRIPGSSHSNPIFVLVDNKPVRASLKSAEWCLKAVDQCWSQKSPQISVAERSEAEKAYAAAREAYRKIISESVK